MEGNGTAEKSNDDLLSACEEYDLLRKEEEVLKISLAGNLSKEDRTKKSKQLMQVKRELAQSLQKVNQNGHHPYLSHV